MSLNIGERTINRVMVLDDDPEARKTIVWCLEDAKLNALAESGPLAPLEKFVLDTTRNADAAIFDHKLSLVGAYASFDGAEAVARLYDLRFPAVLCTSYSKADIDMMRPYRRRVPALIRTDDLDTDTLVEGFEACVREFEGEYSPSRKPWRTLVRVEAVDGDSRYPFFYVAVPAWTLKEKIRLPLDLIPSEYRERIKPGVRFHAQVNIGADNQDDLYFEEFEFD